MEKIKISVYNLYKNNINYNMIGGVASLTDATISAKAAAKAVPKAKMQLSIAQTDFQQQLATNQFNQAKATEAARQQLAIDQLAETTTSRQQRFELDKERFDAENYTLANCREDITEYKFYNLRNQIEMNTLQTRYEKTEDEIKDLLKTNNFDFGQVQNQLQEEAEAMGDDIATLFTGEGKIRVKVHRLRK